MRHGDEHLCVAQGIPDSSAFPFTVCVHAWEGCTPARRARIEPCGAAEAPAPRFPWSRARRERPLCRDSRPVPPAGCATVGRHHCKGFYLSGAFPHVGFVRDTIFSGAFGRTQVLTALILAVAVTNILLHANDDPPPCASPADPGCPPEAANTGLDVVSVAVKPSCAWSNAGRPIEWHAGLLFLLLSVAAASALAGSLSARDAGRAGVNRAAIVALNRFVGPRRIYVVTATPASCRKFEAFAPNVRCLLEDQIVPGAEGRGAATVPAFLKQ